MARAWVDLAIRIEQIGQASGSGSAAESGGPPPPPSPDQPSFGEP
jgi:hypothetical protein